VAITALPPWRSIPAQATAPRADPLVTRVDEIAD
jgi:hypothetical protein